MDMPAMATAAPATSQRSGRCASTTQSHSEREGDVDAGVGGVGAARRRRLQREQPGERRQRQRRRGEQERRAPAAQPQVGQVAADDLGDGGEHEQRDGAQRRAQRRESLTAGAPSPAAPASPRAPTACARPAPGSASARRRPSRGAAPATAPPAAPPRRARARRAACRSSSRRRPGCRRRPGPSSTRFRYSSRMRRLSSTCSSRHASTASSSLRPTRALAAEPQVLRHLLRDRRRAAIEPSGVEIGGQRVADAVDVEAVVREEAPVLGDEERAHHRRRQGVDRAPRRVLRRQRHEAPVDRVADQRRRIGAGQRGDVGERGIGAGAAAVDAVDVELRARRHLRRRPTPARDRRSRRRRGGHRGAAPARAAATPAARRTAASAASRPGRRRRPAPRCRRGPGAPCRCRRPSERAMSAPPCQPTSPSTVARNPAIGCRATAGMSSVTSSTSRRVVARAPSPSTSRRMVPLAVAPPSGESARRRPFADRQFLQARLRGDAVAVDARGRRHARSRRAHQPRTVGRVHGHAGELADAAESRAGERQPPQRAALGLEADLVDGEPEPTEPVLRRQRRHHAAQRHARMAAHPARLRLADGAELGGQPSARTRAMRRTPPSAAHGSTSTRSRAAAHSPVATSRTSSRAGQASCALPTVTAASSTPSARARAARIAGGSGGCRYCHNDTPHAAPPAAASETSPSACRRRIG